MYDTWTKHFLRLIALLVVLGFAQPAGAYKGGTHQEVVNTAWEVMLASQDPALTTGRNLFTTLEHAPRSLRTPDAPLTQAEWDVFLSEIRAALLAINRMPSGLSSNSDSRCAGIEPLRTLGRIAQRISTSYSGRDNLFRGDDVKGNNCSLVQNSRSGIYAQIGQGPVSQFSTREVPADFVPGLAGEFGSTEGQGLALGWHSKAGDDCMEDVVLGINVAQILINFPIPFLGGLSLRQVFDIALVAVALPVLCIGSILGGDDCSLDSARNFAAKANPATALAGLVPPIDADITMGMLTGIPHFINAVGAPGLPHNSFDDRRGMLYDQAGPNFNPGAVDVAINLLLEKTGAVLDVDVGASDTHALLVDRYDLGPGVGDGHSEGHHRRSKWEWNRETVGHTEITPLDNYAYFGWNQFKGDRRRSVAALRWPLHALGDATVPMHVTSTTGWGHVPYEKAMNASLGAMRFDTGSAATVFHVSQLEQARRILGEAYRVRQRIKQRRSELGRTNDTPVRDLITMLAQDTLVTVDLLGGDWYCDTCSVGDFAGSDAATEHYLNEDHQSRMRVLFEKSSAYTLAFLMSAAEQPIEDPVCSETGGACGPDRDCCVGKCENSRCLPPPRPTGPNACDENGHCPHGPCVNDYCEGGTECNKDSQCPDGQCQNGYCSGGCSSGQECPGGRCDNGRCCTVDHRRCGSNAECCGGMCRAETCRPSPGGPGDACTENSDCERGTCVDGHCSAGCATERDCPLEQACSAGACCIPDNSFCTNSADCCGAFSVCGDLGSEFPQCITPLLPGAGACSTPATCLRGRCENEVCRADCSDTVPCDVGRCVEGRCCNDLGGRCVSGSDCCSSVCAGNRCVPPEID